MVQKLGQDYHEGFKTTWITPKRSCSSSYTDLSYKIKDERIPSYVNWKQTCGKCPLKIQDQFVQFKEI